MRDLTIRSEHFARSRVLLNHYGGPKAIMDWKDLLAEAKEGWNKLTSQLPAGLIAPLQITQETPYWQPRFQPDVPINVEWDAKIGNGPDGWGNQELEYYTAAPENSFQ